MCHILSNVCNVCNKKISTKMVMCGASKGTLLCTSRSHSPIDEDEIRVPVTIVNKKAALDLSAIMTEKTVSNMCPLCTASRLTN